VGDDLEHDLPELYVAVFKFSYVHSYRSDFVSVCHALGASLTFDIDRRLNMSRDEIVPPI